MSRRRVCMAPGALGLDTATCARFEAFGEAADCGARCHYAPESNDLPPVSGELEGRAFEAPEVIPIGNLRDLVAMVPNCNGEPDPFAGWNGKTARAILASLPGAVVETPAGASDPIGLEGKAVIRGIADEDPVGADPFASAGAAGPRVPRARVKTDPIGKRPDLWAHDAAMMRALRAAVAADVLGHDLLDRIEDVAAICADRRVPLTVLTEVLCAAVAAGYRRDAAATYARHQKQTHHDSSNVAHLEIVPPNGGPKK